MDGNYFEIYLHQTYRDYRVVGFDNVIGFDHESDAIIFVQILQKSNSILTQKIKELEDWKAQALIGLTMIKKGVEILETNNQTTHEPTNS